MIKCPSLFFSWLLFEYTEISYILMANMHLFNLLCKFICICKRSYFFSKVFDSRKRKINKSKKCGTDLVKDTKYKINPFFLGLGLPTAYRGEILIYTNTNNIILCCNTYI